MMRRGSPLLSRVLFAIFYIAVISQPLPAKADALEGSMRVDYFSSSRSLDKENDIFGTSLQLEAAPQWDTVKGYAEWWYRADNIGRKNNLRGYFRELYLGWDKTGGSLRAGKQRLSWGRADQINPTDNLAPRDYTLLVPETDDQRLGAYAIKGDYFFKGSTLTGIVIPLFQPSKIPLQFPAIIAAREEMPRRTLENTQWALKLDSSGGEIDWSISYFDGFDLLPDVRLDGVGEKINLSLLHNRIRVAGADFAKTLGTYGLRGEAAYFITEDAKGVNPFIKNPYFFYVVGADRTFGGSFNVNIQWVQRIIVHWQNPDEISDPVVSEVAKENALFGYQQSRVHNSFSLRLSEKWLQETLDGDILLVYNITGRDYFLRPKVVYAVTDRIKVTGGIDVYRGPEETPFGRLRDNSGWYAELKYGF